MTYKLFHIATGEEVGIGSNILDSSSRAWGFRGFSRGRLGPKMVVRDINNGVNREMFTSVFPDYEVKEDGE